MSGNGALSRAENLCVATSARAAGECMSNDTQQGAEGQGRRGLGVRGEALAAAYLEARGWELLDRNWRTARGELDLIASRREVRYGVEIELVAFVEVKARRAGGKLPPEASVTARKRRKIVSLARCWRQLHRPHGDCAVRFDVIAVELLDEQEHTLTHFEAAFDARGEIA